MLSVGEPGKGAWLYLGDVPYKHDTVYEGEGWVTSSEENSGKKEHEARYGVDKEASDTTSWKVSLNEVVLMAVAPCGGPIAMLSPPPSRVWIFSQAGRHISDFVPTTTASTIVGLGWTYQERIFTVALDGSLILRTIQGDVLAEEHLFESLPGGRSPLLVDRAEVYSGGAVALLTDGQLLVASTTAFNDEGQLAQHPPNRCMSICSIPWQGGMATTVTAMVVREPCKFQSGGELEVVIATDDCSVVVVGRKGIKSRLVDPPPDDPAIRLAASPNGKFLALFTAGGLLAVMGSDFQTKVLDFDTSTQTPPTQLVWCGEDCVVLHWPGLGVLLVGPYGDWERIQYPGSTTLLLYPELDCCRVLTGKGGLQLLRRVPPAIAAVSSIGSTDPAAMLVDMVEASVDGDPKADESIRTMAHDQLTQAVMTCLRAAYHEMEDANRQKQLLRAVSHGKSFLQDFDANIFVSACLEIRVLHTIRNKDGRGADLPLTYPEFEVCGAESLISQLTSRHLHLLAFTICEHLRLPGAVKAMVVRDWVKCCLSSPGHELISDYKFHKDICSRMELCGRGLSYVDIARAAISAGRSSLTIFLLEDEPLACNQVQVLLEMGECDRALSKALLSADEDLVFIALSHVMHSSVGSSTSTPAKAAVILPTSLSSLHNTNNDTLLEILQNRRDALEMLNAYFSARGGLAEWKLLLDFHLSIGNVCGVGGLTAAAAYAQTRLDDRISSLHEAERLYAKSKDTAFHQAMTKEQIELLEIQRNLEKTLCAPGAFMDASLYATVHAIITMASMAPAVNQKAIMAEANKLHRKFRISDTRFWHIKLKAFAEIGNWGSLRVMAHERRSPIGYAPFVTAAIQQGNRNEAEFYIDKVTSVEERTALLKQFESLK